MTWSGEEQRLLVEVIQCVLHLLAFLGAEISDSQANNFLASTTCWFTPADTAYGDTKANAVLVANTLFHPARVVGNIVWLDAKSRYVLCV